MRTTINRKLIETTIYGHTINYVKGNPKVEKLNPVIAYGNLTKAEALKELKRVYGRRDGLAVGELVAVEKNYQISVKDFVKYAKEV